MGGGRMIDKELIKAFEEYIELLENERCFDDIVDAGLTPQMAKRLISALKPYTGKYEIKRPT
jgi:hypothetical protein